MVKTASITRRIAQGDAALTAKLDSSLDTLWVSMQPLSGRPLNFSPDLLTAFERLLDRIEENRWHFEEADSGLRTLHHVAGGHYLAIGAEVDTGQ